MADHWQVHAVNSADRNNRTRADSFLLDDHPAAPHGMDYHVWVLKNGARTSLVDTADGPLILASDAAHYWETYLTGRLFPIVVDAADMRQGFQTLLRLGADRPDRIVPGHDPLLRAHYPLSGTAEHIFRLDKGPVKPLPTTW